ncbi:beta-fructofuranosidase [Trifolium repens]|nr:beta-fructofuranosidase [Trifolium repens]
MENITKDASPKSINSEQPYRTGYHFQPLKNWMNGPMYYKGVYHFFYQRNPDGATFGHEKMIWGHSV